MSSPVQWRYTKRRSGKIQATANDRPSTPKSKRERGGRFGARRFDGILERCGTRTPSDARGGAAWPALLLDLCLARGDSAVTRSVGDWRVSRFREFPRCDPLASLRRERLDTAASPPDASKREAA